MPTETVTILKDNLQVFNKDLTLGVWQVLALPKGD